MIRLLVLLGTRKAILTASSVDISTMILLLESFDVGNIPPSGALGYPEVPEKLTDVVEGSAISGCLQLSRIRL